MPNRTWVPQKINLEAKIALETIRQHYKPDMDLQEIASLAITEYLHAYYPDLEKTVAQIIRRQQEARRADGADHHE